MSDETIGLVPAAGKGVRLGLPYPKELYPIIRDNRYKPVSQFVLENLTSAGVEHVVFVINETKHQLIGYFGDGSRFGCHVSYVVQERRGKGSSSSPGLAHALDSAYHVIRDKTVLFGMADTIMTPIKVFYHIMEEMTAEDDVSLGLYRTRRPEKFGMVELDDTSHVRRIVDKPSQTDLDYMWGCMIWRPRFTEHLHNCVWKRGLGDFALVMNAAIKEGLRFRGVRIEGTYADLGTYEEIMELEQQHRAP